MQSPHFFNLLSNNWIYSLILSKIFSSWMDILYIRIRTRGGRLRLGSETLMEDRGMIFSPMDAILSLGNTPCVGNIGQRYMKRWSQCVIVKLFRNEGSLRPWETRWSATLERVIQNNPWSDAKWSVTEDIRTCLWQRLEIDTVQNRYRTMKAERRRLEASSKTNGSLERSKSNARDQEVIADGQNCFVVGTSRLWGIASQKNISKV